MPLRPERYKLEERAFLMRDAELKAQYRDAIKPLAHHWDDFVLTASGVSTLVAHGVYTLSMEDTNLVCSLIFHTGALLGETLDLDDTDFHEVQVAKADTFPDRATMADVFAEYLPHFARAERVLALILESDLPTTALRHNLGEAGFFLTRLLDSTARSSLAMTAQIDQARAQAERIGHLDC